MKQFYAPIIDKESGNNYVIRNSHQEDMFEVESVFLGKKMILPIDIVVMILKCLKEFNSGKEEHK